MADEMNTRVRMLVRSSRLQSVPVDGTLSISGQAADAKATGDALALKADLSQVVGITVNGQAADAQGAILVDGGDIPVGGNDATTLEEAVAELWARTAETIPMSAETGAQSIAEAFAGTVQRDANGIAMGGTDTRTVKEAMDEVAGDAEALEQAVEEIQGWDSSDIPYETGETASVKDKLDALRTDVDGIQGWDSSDIHYAGASGETVKDKLDDLADGRVRTVNGNEADSEGNVLLTTVPYADDLTTDDNIQVDSPFVVRTSGGMAAINTGSAWLRRLRGNSVHTGFVPESLVWDVINAEREDPADNISITLDRSVFVGYVTSSGTVTLVYSNGWTVDGEGVVIGDYGITVDGTPIAGDMIVVRYVKEERGSIASADPESLVSTGWNLFDSTAGYARVAAYDGKYMVGGTYSTIRFAKTPGGTSSPIVVDAAGQFEISENGYVLLSGASEGSTFVICCWTDWTDGYHGNFEGYRENSIDLSAIMESLPYGLCSVGSVYDEINFNTKQIIQRIGRTDYSAEARAAAAATGRAYDFDEDYVYLEMTPEEIAAATSSFSLENQYEADAHGIEFFEGTQVEVRTEIAYGASLKDKLRMNVLTMSQQSLSDAQKTQVLENTGARAAIDAADSAIRAILRQAVITRTYSYKYASISASGTLSITAANLGIEEIEGYKPLAIIYYTAGASQVVAYMVNAVTSGTVIALRNVTSTAQSNKTCKVTMAFIRNELM